MNRYQLWKRVSIAAGLLLASQTAFSQTQTGSPQVKSNAPAWLQPAVLAAALRIQLTPEQRPLFRAALTDMVNNRVRTAKKLLRQNNQTHLERKFRTATRRQIKKLDEQVSEFLTSEQLPRYRAYSDLLATHLSNSKFSQGEQDSAKHTDGIGTHNPDWH